MFRISRFQHLLKALPRGQFQSMVDAHQADRYAKAFGCYDLLVAQMFGHLNGCRSLREVEAGFNAHASHHYHLGTGAIRRSTLADACGKRPPDVFENLAQTLMACAHRRVRKTGEHCLRLLDSTSFTLKGRGFDDWASATRTRNTQGLKLHIVYAPGQAVPVLQQITAANVNDITAAAAFPIVSGLTYVFDKGYCDYNWWARVNQQGAVFVTRLKSNAKTQVIEHHRVPDDAAGGVLADQTIELSNRHPGAGRKNLYTTPLRRVTVARPDNASALVLVTNDFQRTAADVARCYKDRWQIELFFKWIKQNLQIRTFFGRSQNAVRIQILCALITYLLVALYRANHAPDTAMIRLLDTLRAALFQRPELDDAVERRRRQRRGGYAAIQPSLL